MAVLLDFECALVDHLKDHLGVRNVAVAQFPDSEEHVNLPQGADGMVLVHFMAARPASSNARVRIDATISFAVICYSRSRAARDSKVNALVITEAVERALAGQRVAGGQEITIAGMRLEDQTGGLWRHVVEIHTVLPRGVGTPIAPQPIITRFEGDRP